MDSSARADSLDWTGWFAGAAFTLVAAATALWQATQHGYVGPGLAAAITALTLLLVPFFLLGTTDLAQRLAAWVGSHRARAFPLAGLLVVPWLVYAVGTGTFSWASLLKVIAYILVPLLLLLWAQRSGPPPVWHDGFAVLAIWLPLELGAMRGVWPWHDEAGAYMLGEFLGVDAALLLFVSVRALDRVGYSLAIRRADLQAALPNFLMFAAIALPIGLATGFIAYNHKPPDLLRFVGRFLGIFLTIAVPEELLFRGIVQNLLQRVLPATSALVVAALIFGAAHLNNGPTPDWRYLLLATIAGIFYGRAYRSSGGLMAACLVHAMVDTVWVEFLR